MNSGYGIFAEFYDQLMYGFDYSRLADYYDGFIKENGLTAAKSGILLDLACGTGKLSRLMAEKGWDVIAVDSSPEMLSKAEPHTNVSYICQDMNELDLFGTIDAAICSFDGLNHLADESELYETIKRVSLFMNPGGVFVFDLNTLYKHETILAHNIFVRETDEIYCVWRNEYSGGGVVYINLDFFSKQDKPESGLYRRFTEEIREIAYDSDTLISLCERAGFEVVAQHDFVGISKKEKVVFVCRKVRNRQ
ncbi:MAG: class I SAM-dependent methyltransferase [Oscillospiraceae bacterium]|nr:class I SAM-dependent methyltransferase [Oscillospiraceae bacterium]